MHSCFKNRVVTLWFLLGVVMCTMMILFFGQSSAGVFVIDHK